LQACHSVTLLQGRDLQLAECEQSANIGLLPSLGARRIESGHTPYLVLRWALATNI